MTLPFYSVGHSTRTIAEFVALLRAADVDRVVDIRTIPRSRTNPQYNKDTLPAHLSAFGIDYTQIAELGGRRSKSKTIPPQLNAYWDNRSFHNYADYALTETFASGLAELIELGRKQRCAMMCSEAVWWRCHRRIVTDHLLARGQRVFHLMHPDRIEPAALTKRAQVQDHAAVTYPGAPTDQTNAH